MTEKHPKVNIINISAVRGDKGTTVFGLGDDGNVYIWWSLTTKWILFMAESNTSQGN